MKYKNGLIISRFLNEPSSNRMPTTVTGGTYAWVRRKNNAFPAVIVYQGHLENNTRYSLQLNNRRYHRLEKFIRTKARRQGQ